MSVVLLIPGQGAQKVGMGQDLAERFPVAKETFDEVDDALGVKLSQLMWQGPAEDLTLTHNAQPAILAHSVAAHRVASQALGPVAAAAGHSLGEYSAYVAAGSLDVGEAARLVRRRGELMLESGKQRPGTMAAVLGLGTGEVESCCAAASSGDEVVFAANLNAPDQTVISGDPPAVERAGAACKEAGAKRVLPLQVSGAFHSPLMAPAAAGLDQALSLATLADPQHPVLANATAQPVVTGIDAARLLVEQLTAPVRWVDSMRRIAEMAPEARFVELGPGSVLSGLAKRILDQPDTLALGTADQLEEFLA